MAEPDVSPLRRPSFFEGQRLTADDLTATQAFNRDLRWLHNRGLHTWGVALGLMVTGKRGERVVTLEPGYALDCLGRDLVVGETTSIPVPAVAGSAGGGGGSYYLTASYAEDRDVAPTENRMGVCAGQGAVRRPEAACLRWQDRFDTSTGTRYRPGLDVILAAVTVKSCRLDAPVSLGERKDARPPTQPYVSAGATTAGATAWEPWLPAATFLGVQTTVDTSSAGFQATPRYLAHVVGERILTLPTMMSPRGELIDGLVNVVNPDPVRFVLRMLMPAEVVGPNWVLNPAYAFGPGFLVKLRTTLRWHVVWMGVEG